MPRIPQYNQQTSAPSGVMDSSVRPSQMGSVVSGAMEQVGGMIRQQQAVENANDVFRARRLDAYDQEQERLRTLEAKEIADGKAADIQLAKLTEFNALKNSIGPDQDFVTEWELRRKQMDEGELRTLETTNKLAPQMLRAKLEDQRLSFGVAAIGESDRLRSSNSIYRFNKKADTQQKALMQVDGLTGDAELLRLNEGLKTDASLAMLPELEANALHDKTLDQYSRTVGERMASDPDQVETLYSAIYGVPGYSEANITTTEDGTVSYSGLKVSPANGKWDSVIAREANSQGVAPNLVAAVMYQESRGHAEAKSGAGAIGLMQLMPDTAKALGVDPAKPDQNIKGGVSYLRQLSTQFQGDTTKVLSAYNAGPKTVEKAVAAAKKAGNPDAWPEMMRKFQSLDNYKQTKDYVEKITATLGGEVGAITGTPTPPPNLNLLQFASPETAKYLGDLAARTIAQNRRTRREMSKVELNARIDAEKTAAADGKTISNPLTEADWIRAGEKPDDAAIKYANHKFTQDIAPVIGELSRLPKDQRDEIVRKRDPGQGDATDITYGARKDAFSLARAANDRIDAQIKEDPAGTAARLNPAVAKAKENFDSISKISGAPPASIAAARATYIAATSSWQRSQGVDFPAVMTAQEVASVKQSWIGQADGPAKAADAMVNLARTYGESYPMALKQITKDLPSEALWVGILADDPGTEGTRQQLAAASKVFADPKNIPQRGKIEAAVDAAFSDYAFSLHSTDPRGGGVEQWNYLRYGAVKLAAVKVATRGADPVVAAKEAYQELVASQSEFVNSGNHITSSFRQNGELVTIQSPTVVRLPKMWGGMTQGQKPSDLLDGANTWLETALPKLDLATTSNPASYIADIKNHGAFVTSPNDDGLVLTLSGSPVRTKDGKPVLITWRRAGEYIAPKTTAGSVMMANPGVYNLVQGVKDFAKSYISPR